MGRKLLVTWVLGGLLFGAQSTLAHAQTSPAEDQGPPFTIGRIGIGTAFPYQLIAADLRLDLRPASFLHVHAGYGFGLAPEGGGAHHYAGYLGFGVEWTGETEARFEIDREYGFRVVEVRYDTSPVTTYHGLYAEAGLTGGSLQFTRTPGLRFNQDVITDVVHHVAVGGRYVYAYNGVRDDGRQSRSQVISYAHLLLSPFGAPDGVTHIQPVIGDAEVYAPGSVGVQAGVSFPFSFIDLTATDIALGYHPGAQSLFAHVATTIPFWL
jgi:hypothetical protein